MKFIKSIIVVVAFILSYGSAQAQMGAAIKVANEFTLVGDIKGAGNVKVTIEKLGTPGVYASTMAKEGKFTMMKCKGTLPYPFKLTVGDKSMFLILQNGRISVKGDINDLQAATVTDGSTHQEYMRLLTDMKDCKTDRDKDTAMEVFMSKNSHSWVSMYCLEVLHKKYGDNTQKMRMLLDYVTHYKGSKQYDDVEKAVAAVEATE